MERKGYAGKLLYGILFALMIFVCVSPVCTAKAAEGYGMYEHPYVEFSPDGQAWTVAEELPAAPIVWTLIPGYYDYPEYWYLEGTVEYTGRSSSLGELNTGEHYYDYDREGEIPIGYWKVAHTQGKCIHECMDSVWHGVVNGGGICLCAYYSGWNGYCADCGGKINNALVYMSKEAAGTLATVDIDLGYYYVCPAAYGHIENTSDYVEHTCQAVSYNRYRVAYLVNASEEETSGYMDYSFHMYNNSTVFEGREIVPQTRLSLNTYIRNGYVFTGWNTEPDGSGTVFTDGQEIYNLTEENYVEGTNEGTITLYAQWQPAQSTLRINPNGGKYEGKSSVTEILQGFNTSYTAAPEKVQTPKGYRVSFNTHGGKAVSTVKASMEFKGWLPGTSLSGFFDSRNNRYWFTGSDGSTDTLTATYERGSILLPTPVWSDEENAKSFGGWFEDAAYTKPAGFGGDSYTPKADITLHAQWVPLVLSSEENYAANDKKGAVNLSWYQNDSYTKTYKLYESADGTDFTLICNAWGEEGENARAGKVFYKKGVQETYTVPYTGFYLLCAYGGSGGAYGAYSGGEGGYAEGRFYLNAGDRLSITVGGNGESGGFNGGGAGSLYGNGGGATLIVSKEKGLLLVAPGGGGADGLGNGSDGGAVSEYLKEAGDMTGEEGEAGGGAGYRGGGASRTDIHVHTDACYHQGTGTEYTLIKRNASGGRYVYDSSMRENYTENAWMNTLKAGCGGFAVHTENCFDARKNQAGVYGHTGRDGSSGGKLYLFFGRVENTASPGTYTAPSFSPEYIPTKGNTSVTIDAVLLGIHSSENGSGYINASESYLNVYTQDGVCILSKNTASISRTGSYDDMVKETAGESVRLTEYGQTKAARFVETVSIPDGTEGIYFDLVLKQEGSDHTYIMVNEVSFSGGSGESVSVCGYTQGQVLSHRMASGGSAFVNEEYAVSSVTCAGGRNGNGTAFVQPDNVGYMSVLTLDGVPAPDLAAPGSVTFGEILGDGNGTVDVYFEAPEDYGTPYRYKAESYLAGTEQCLGTSNITEEMLTTGVAGYYYVVDKTAGTTVTPENAMNENGVLLTETMLRLTNVTEPCYAHIAAVDAAGNLGETEHIYIDDPKPYTYDIHTKRVEITDVIGGVDYGTIYQKNADTWYVRADGEGAFRLSYKSYIEGIAGTGYQINRQIFDFRLLNGSSQRFITGIPYTHPLSSTAALDASAFTRQMSGAVILKDAMNIGASRYDNASHNAFFQCFTAPCALHGKTVVVTPVVEAATEEETKCSDWNEDVVNGIRLIGDGEAPVVSGLEFFSQGAYMQTEPKELTICAKADDALSGVRRFYIRVENADNAGVQIYESDENGKIELTISEDSMMFHGDYVLTVYAEDNVGNAAEVSYRKEALTLETEIARILAPHEPVFRCGEGGILKIKTTGYAERIEVIFPEELTALNASLNKTYEYLTGSRNQQEELLQFIIPLYSPVNCNMQITVRAYKNDKIVEEHPAFSIVGSGEGILGDIRTRLR